MILYLPKWLWCSLICLLGFYLIAFEYKTDVLYIVQALLTLVSAYLFKQRRYYLLAGGLCSIMIADISYYIQIYRLHLDSNNAIFYLSTSLLYSLGFALVASSIYKRVSKAFGLFFTYKISILSVSILAGASIPFLLYPLYLLISKGTFNYNGLATITELCTSIPLIIIAYLAVILTFNIADACLAIGALLIGLVDWGIQFEFITIGMLAFSYYDFFWFFGLLLIFSRAVDPIDFNKLHFQKVKSLRIQLKILILTACLLPVGAYYLFNRGDLHLSISFFLFGSAISLLVASIAVQYFSNQLTELTREIEQIFINPTSHSDAASLTDLPVEWEESLKMVLKNKLYQDKIEAENEKILIEKKLEISAQVSHDIRSPLAALKMALDQIGTVPEDYRLIIKGAVQRINDIANNLLSTNTEQGLSPMHLTAELVAPLIRSIVSEKRMQFMDKLKISIDAELGQSDDLFAKINPVELKRLISNLINNSVDACEGVGSILLTVAPSGQDKILISLTDSGKGIPPHILDKLGKKGFTYGKAGKESGSGLGIFHAKNTIESLGGTFEIKSNVGIGTTVLILLPKVTQIYDRCLIDDDSIVRRIWELAAKKNDIKLLTCDSLKSLQEKISGIDFQTEIYIDLNLADKVRGQDVASFLHNLGYKKLYFATGNEAHQITDVPKYILGITGKDPVRHPCRRLLNLKP